MAMTSCHDSDWLQQLTTVGADEFTMSAQNFRQKITKHCILSCCHISGNNRRLSHDVGYQETYL
jgi:hypothetical protein